MNDDDKTVLNPRQPPIDKQPEDTDKTVLFLPNTLSVDLLSVNGNIIQTFSFSRFFTVGRALDNDIVIEDNKVSRQHLKFNWENDVWWVHNIKATNHLYISGRLVEHKEKLNFPVLISLGSSGLQLNIQQAISTKQIAEQAEKTVISQPQETKAKNLSTPSHRNLSPEQVKARFLGEEDVEDAGDATIFLRGLIKEDRIKRKKSYKKVIWTLAVLFCVSVGIVTYQQFALNNARKLAIDMFYLTVRSF